ncbi:MAG TPA: hypothetical protein VFA22_06060 [Stellaceae bacterium]|nr:hypothetical protein [Stellaceae bacterium]
MRGLALDDGRRRQRAKNLALLTALLALVALFFAITLVKLGAGQ